MPKRIIEKKEIPLPEVKNFLEKRKKEGELSTLQNVTLDYVSKLVKIEEEKAERLREKLIEEYKLSPFTATQIVNILPRNVDELRPLLTLEGRIFLTSELQKILDTIHEYTG
ncbi:MAG: RNA polymerase Rpb4 family protein [archaeon GB-1867-097]|nr:RNA polymerase Rpb4 family protein [Candidatus Culexmicrobium thermophilum]MCS7384362.1 RNA polymerase Rpb4 family protein [Candidatus Culexmicrobium thermophilum]HDO20923.1 hypothetical protein [Candidatus Bathyarchaeota archaeon]